MIERQPRRRKSQRELGGEKLNAIARFYADYRATGAEISLDEFREMLDGHKLTWSDIVDLAAEAGSWNEKLKNIQGE